MISKYRNLIFIYILYLFFLPTNLIARADLPFDNLAYPVLFISDNYSDSGFYYEQDDNTYFVTARHVLFEESKVDLSGITNEILNHLYKTYEKLPPRIRRNLIIAPEFKDAARIQNIDDVKIENIQSIHLEYFGVMSKSELSEINKTALKKHQFLIAKLNDLYNISQVLRLRHRKGTLISYPKDNKEILPYEINIDLDSLYNERAILYNEYSDITAIKIGIKKTNTTGETYIKFNKDAITIAGNSKSGIVTMTKSGVKNFNDVLVSNEVYIFGYPTSLSLNPEIDIRRPLLRKGIIAGKNEIFKTIILDCPIYQGNSGGLVLEVEQVSAGNFQFRAIGIISKFVPYKKDWFENSGYSIAEPLDGLVDLLSK